MYFVRPLQAATVCSPGKPFTAHQFEIRKLNDDGVFNLSDWRGQPAYSVDVTAGVLSANPY